MARSTEFAAEDTFYVRCDAPERGYLQVLPSEVFFPRIIKYESYLSAVVTLSHFLCHVLNDEAAGANKYCRPGDAFSVDYRIHAQGLSQV